MLFKDGIFEQSKLNKQSYTSENIYKMIKKRKIPFNELSRDTILDLILKNDMLTPRNKTKNKSNCTNFYKLETIEEKDQISSNIPQISNAESLQMELPSESFGLDHSNNFLYLIKTEQARSDSSMMHVHNAEDYLQDSFNLNNIIPKTNQFNNFPISQNNLPSNSNKLTNNTIIIQNNEVKQSREKLSNKNLSFSLDNDCLFDLDEIGFSQSKLKSFNRLELDMMKNKIESHNTINRSEGRLENSIMNFDKFKSFCEAGQITFNLSNLTNLSDLDQKGGEANSTNNLNNNLGNFTISPKSAFVKKNVFDNNK
jgi:hypothetical protein